MRRAVLDANVYISAIIQPAGTPGRLVERFLRDASFEVVLSPTIVDEVLRAMAYPKVRKLLRGAEARLWFEDLVVHPDERKRGIGEALLKHVVAQARADGVLRITLLTDMQNERAQAMYRRAGFVGSPMRPMRLKIRQT